MESEIKIVGAEEFWDLMGDPRFKRISFHEGAIGNTLIVTATAPEQIPGFIGEKTQQGIEILTKKKEGKTMKLWEILVVGILAILVWAALVQFAHPGELGGPWEIKPKYPYVGNQNQLMQPGGYLNPYVLQQPGNSLGYPGGFQSYEIKPKYFFSPDLGSYFQPGGSGNPWVIKPIR